MAEGRVTNLAAAALAERALEGALLPCERDELAHAVGRGREAAGARVVAGNAGELRVRMLDAFGPLGGERVAQDLLDTVTAPVTYGYSPSNIRLQPEATAPRTDASEGEATVR